jgi:Uma2 family endonuclease
MPFDVRYDDGLLAGGDDLGPISVDDWFALPESNRHEELVHGWIVREASPSYGHQLSLMLLGVQLFDHVVKRGRGVVLEHIDIVLDEGRRLVLQPDMVVLLNDRKHIVVNQRLRGVPNLVIEVQSPSTGRRDKRQKFEWYRRYGVQEYWIIDATKRQFDVIDFTAAPDHRANVVSLNADLLYLGAAVQSFSGSDVISSPLLPGFGPTVESLVEYPYDNAEEL